jgi:membrane-bound lytic murein transglycosylase F
LHFVFAHTGLRLQKMFFLWHQKITQNGTLARIRERYVRPLAALSSSDVNHFFALSQGRLHHFEALFKDAAQANGIPWQLLAAVSFQESNWDEDSRSYTGVRGLMMLTSDPAERVGIRDRTDPEQCIWGGAKYLKYLFSLQPRFLSLREKWALTLATYNVGYGHLKDAQRLAVSLGKNPYSWKDLREVLPLLSQPQYFTTLEFGAARGQEPVDFTERVLGYLDLMTTPI